MIGKETILISSKEGYRIFGRVHPKTKKVQQFFIRGKNVNSEVDYFSLSEAEGVVKYHIDRIMKEKKFRDQHQALHRAREMRIQQAR